MMRRASILGSALVLIVVSAVVLSGIGRPTGAAERGADQGKLRHVVLFKFKDDATPEQVKKVEDAFRQLPEKIDTIVEYEWGTNNSPEGLSQGFTHCFLVTFKNEEGRGVYLPHPAHKAFVEVLKPHLDKVLVVDYFARP